MDQQFYAGYLESMFAGVGTEFLYRPKGANWAIGADVNLILNVTRKATLVYMMRMAKRSRIRSPIPSY